MTSLAWRGKWIFLILAGLIFIDQMSSGVLGLFPREGPIRWRNVLGAFGMAIAVPMLWQGDLWLSRIVAAALAFAGGTKIYVCINLYRMMAEITEPHQTAIMWKLFLITGGIIGVFGLFYLLSGLAFLLLPSVCAFFKHQRERAFFRRFGID